MERRFTTWLALGTMALLAAGCGSTTGDDTDADGDVPTEGTTDELDVPADGDVPTDGDGDGPDGLCLCTSDEDCQDDSYCNGEEQCVDCECRPGVALADGTACDDGDPCTADEACTGGICTGGMSVCLCDTDDDCVAFDDGNLCNGRLLCVGRECRFAPETVVTCDPTGNTDCRVNLCTPATGECAMTAVADGMSCDDGNECTVGDACAAGLCVGGPSTCECEATADCAPYEDGDLCNGTLVCEPGSHTCVVDPGTLVTCDPSGDTACRANRCDPATGTCGMQPRGEGTSCDDGDACTVGDACAAGSCVGAPRSCADGNPCTDDGCDPASGCVYTPNTAACDDGNACTVGDACSGGVCSGAARDCDDDNVCTDDGCDPATGCTHVNNTAACDDGNACTVDDACSGGSCTGAARDCNDDNVCTDDGCDPATGCTHTNNTAACDDGELCTTPDVCSGGVCVGTATGLTECDGACYDLLTDRNHCGDCDTACLFDEDCVGGHCVVRAWETVGRAAVNPTLPALAHALGSDGTTPHVAWVADEATDNAYVHRLGAVGWTQLSGTLNGGAEAQPVIDIQFNSTQPYVFYMDRSMLMTEPDHVKTLDSAGAGWIEVGAPGYRPACVMHFNAALALEGARPHFSFVGAGGCGIGVGHARWTGTAWWDTPNPPSPMGTGLLTMNGGGSSDVVYDGTRALVALIDEGWRYVRYWTATIEPGSWANLGPSFNRGPPVAGTAAANYLWMALDATGRVWVAFAEQEAGVQRVFVKRYDATSGAWTLIGGGPVSDPTRNSDYPSLAFVGTTPHVAWVEDVSASGGPGVAGGVIRVKRWNGLAWERVGAPLNNDAAADALLPYLVGIGAVPYVAFREPVAAPQRIYVKRFP
ncbi:MAG: hypothetical protein JXB32_08450 [Deltaproteobacteria bacterium]|nr:hypothetical protein [Deltaproteobacteria bacterium]